MDELWKKVMKGEKVENRGSWRGETIANSLTDTEILRIVAKFGNERDRAQVAWDLKTPRYRLFDEIGMMLTGRVDDQDTAREIANAYTDCLDEEEVMDRATLYDCFNKKVMVMGRKPVEFIDVERLGEVD